MSVRVRHCSFCNDTTHIITKCPAAIAYSNAKEAAERKAAEEEEEAIRTAEEKELTDFAAQPIQTQLLELFKMIKELRMLIENVENDTNDRLESIEMKICDDESVNSYY